VKPYLFRQAFLSPEARPRVGAVRLMTWNVHKGIGGVDRRYAPWRIAAVIRHHDPDIAMLQEVADGIPRSHRDRQTELWGAVLGYPYRVFAPDVRLKEGQWGNAILSRFPIIHSHHVSLSFPLKKKRGALSAEMDIRLRAGRHLLNVVNVHLGLSGMERLWQVRRLLASAPLAGLGRNSRVVVAGDTNDWSGKLAWPRSALRKAGFALAHGTHKGAPKTFPAWYPVAGLDRFYFGGPIICRSAYRSGFSLARTASDHLPLIVDIDL
jgi:endonuclease/exonuclease/phosphatase family metal-dependent hydrolase